jgi:hypothetical protein
MHLTKARSTRPPGPDSTVRAPATSSSAASEKMWMPLELQEPARRCKKASKQGSTKFIYSSYDYKPMTTCIPGYWSVPPYAHAENQPYPDTLLEVSPSPCPHLMIEEMSSQVMHDRQTKLESTNRY